MTVVLVNVDWENSAAEWWGALAAAYPKFYAAWGPSQQLAVTPRALEALAALPGWTDGPVYARTALVVRDLEPDEDFGRVWDSLD